jgi:competence ComEA-like helix-hairpin-helix protein
MDSFTHQEKLTFLFIISSLILGLGVMHFKKSHPQVPAAGLDINMSALQINETSHSELTGLPGIGEVLAGRIMDHRKQNGPFTSKEEIKKVKGIGPKKFEAIKEFLIVE